MKPRYAQADLSKVKTISIRSRKSKVQFKEFGKPFDPAVGSFGSFIRSLPRILVAADLQNFASDVVTARRRHKPVIVMIGAHVVKVGLSPVLIDLMKRNLVTALAMNSAAAIHDTETALFGQTSEDVETYLADGRFGMSRQTGEFINGVLERGMTAGTAGYGEVLGRALGKARHRRISILATAYDLRIPATIHAAIGTDIIHQQPSMNGAATGEMSFRDFKVLCNIVGKLTGGGVVMNIGSAVVLPEVFLKALTVARNLGAKARGFTSANFDMLQHYRPRMNVVQRPTRNGGTGYLFTGHHEIMIPLLAAMIKERLRSR
jgi:deoxyhypusine synthase